MSKVLVRSANSQPYWKERFVGGLPKHFSYQERERQFNEGHTDFTIVTCGDITNTIERLGSLNLCNDIRFKLEKNGKYARQELGSFCEQFGYPPLKATIYYSPEFLLNLKQIKTNTPTLLSNFDYDHFKKEKKIC